jgi:aromatic ring-cleaving dioxygenase
MKIFIKNFIILRTDADMFIQLAAQRKTSANMTAAWRCLQLAKCWLGEAEQEEAGLKLPHTDDVYTGDLSPFEAYPLLEWLSLIRENIKVLIHKISPNDCIGPVGKARDLLHEAYFYYGFEIEEKQTITN